MAKNLVLGQILAHIFQIRSGKFYKNLASPVSRYQGQLSSCTISEKSNNPILRKFSDGQTDGLKEGQTAEREIIGCCPMNVECPKEKWLCLQTTVT